MKTKSIFLLAALLGLCGCQSTYDGVVVKDPITVTFPVPTKTIESVSLTPQQKEYVKGSSQMSFRLLEKLNTGETFLCSPLSLQCALSMTANGASGETLREMLDVLGFGEDGMEALNAYNKSLLDQLPAVDKDVTLKLTDALLVNDMFPLQEAFQNTVQDNYYAAVENDNFADPATTAARVNEWADRNTEGFIKEVLTPSDIIPNTAALLMNALYFKAKWAGSEMEPMFREEFTKDENFTLESGVKITVPMMRHGGSYFRYAQRDGYLVVAVPYANWKYYMYIILPEEGNSLASVAASLASTPWEEITSGMSRDAEVYLKLPRFEAENRYKLKETLKALGMEKAFLDNGDAQFDRMFEAEKGTWFWIEEVIQKNRISVAEWGTEAASVTVVDMGWASSVGPGEEEPKRIYCYCDHPFLFVIGEATSGTILFEGAYMGK